MTDENYEKIIGLYLEACNSPYRDKALELWYEYQENMGVDSYKDVFVHAFIFGMIYQKQLETEESE